MAAAAIASGDGKRRPLGKDHGFWTGGLVGVGVGSTLAAGKEALQHGAPARWASHHLTRLGPTGKFAIVAAISTLPSYALLRATSGDSRLLGKDHDFWSGTVWGLAGVGAAAIGADVATAGSMPKAWAKLHHLGPLGLGWLAGDVIALGLDAKLNQ